MSSLKQDYRPTFRNSRQSFTQNSYYSEMDDDNDNSNRPETRATELYSRQKTENQRPADIIKRLPETFRERFYKTPTLGPYLELIIQHCILVKKTNYIEILEGFINEYETLIKTDPRTGVIRAYARKVIGKNI